MERLDHRVRSHFEATVVGLAAGTYNLEIDFAETVFHGEGQRLIEITRNWVKLGDPLDVFKAAGGFARAYRFQTTLDIADDPYGWPLSLRFQGLKGDAMFNAIRLRDASGRVTAEISAAVLQASSPRARN